MKLFYFVTGTVPVTSGRGVEYDDGTVAYRLVHEGLEGEVVCGCVADIFYAYEGQQDFAFEYVADNAK